MTNFKLLLGTALIGSFLCVSANATPPDPCATLSVHSKDKKTNATSDQAAGAKDCKNNPPPASPPAGKNTLVCECTSADEEPKTNKMWTLVDENTNGTARQAICDGYQDGLRDGVNTTTCAGGSREEVTIFWKDPL